MIEANGGVLSKLTTFSNSKQLSSYTYLKSAANLDFEPNTSNLTPYNARDKKSIKKDSPARHGNLEEFQPYSNICGLLALSAEGLPNIEKIYSCIQEAKEIAPPSYD